MTNDLISLVADTIIEKLENFKGSWETPFLSACSHNIATKKCYRGINILLLDIARSKNDFSSCVWGTFKQWKEKGCPVRKGEKGTTILFWKPLVYKLEVETENGDLLELENQSFVARSYCVFNGSQVEGYTQETEQAEFNFNVDSEKFFENTKIEYRFDGSSAFYNHKKDYVCLPNKKHFNNESDFISTLSHETVHATGHKNRLNRDFSGCFGSKSYAFEELVADIGAGFVSGYLGYEYQFSKNNLAYLKSWLSVLKNDKKAIFKACSHAQKAFDYLLTLQEM